MADMTPMMKQYLSIKAEHPGCLLFFRLGDFYEMFFEDAKIASRELELVLTGRDCGQEERAPMCGVPFHSYESYVARLVAKGYKVAICEQVEDPAKAQGLVKRDIVRIITPGTVIEGSMLDEGRNNYLCTVFALPSFKDVGVCFTDCSTGDVHLTRIVGDDTLMRLQNEMARFRPSEILLSEGAAAADSFAEFVTTRLGVQADVADEMQVTAMMQRVKDHFGHVDVLIHNAGVAHQALLTDTDTDTWRRLMGVHMDGAYYCCKAVIPSMVARQRGVILTVSSMWGVTGASCEVAYSAAKAGLIGFSKALAKELGPSHIRVNCVAPGVMDTDMCAEFDEQTRKELCDETPLCRIGTAEDVANTLLFLASEQASFITGQVVGVNGGFLI